MIFAQYSETAKQLDSTKSLQSPTLVNDNVTIFAYDDLKLGQIIKDPGLLKLILKALKWDDARKSLDQKLEQLKTTNFQDVLCNPALLRDEDLMHLLGPYVQHDAFITLNKVPSAVDTIYEAENSNITQMEVGVDPELFFPFDDDDETRSAEESMVRINELEPLRCTLCPDTFDVESDLQAHILKHMIDKQSAEDEAAEARENRTPLPVVKRRRRKPTTNKFTCSYCNKKLSTKGNLKVHVETHKPKGKFRCDKCERV